MPVPKRRKSASKSRMRRAANMNCEMGNCIPCDSCGSLRFSHHICPTCGRYNSRHVACMSNKTS